MKILSKHKLLACITILSFPFISCKKFVAIDPPVTLLATAGVFNDNSTATSAQTVIYSQMGGESYKMALNTGLLSDELINYSPSADQVQLYTNAMTPIMKPGPWGGGYNYIYQANAVIEGLQNNHGVNPIINQQLTGEAKFIRAFWHFYLANCYGDIPLVTSTDYRINNTIARTPKEDIFRQIITDLSEAQILLNTNYIDFSDTTVTSERTRPTHWAASALLARAYLYTTKYDSAEAVASSIINHTSLYGLEPDLNNVFLANSTEAIWQLQISQPDNGFATTDGYHFILNGQPGFYEVSLSTQLLGGFEPGDSRRTNWIHDTTFAGNPYSYPYKYKLQNTSPTRKEYTMILRLAEQYLIRAEARAQQGNMGGALADLNTIRVRARLSNYEGATDKASLLQAILHERQVEFFTEWGHRWFDMIRTKKANAVMSVATPLKGGTWSSDEHQLLFPLSLDEIRTNSNLLQNPGY